MRLIREIWSQSHYLYQAVLLSILILLAYMFIQDNGRKTMTKLSALLERKWLIMFFFYFAFMMICAVLGRELHNPYQSVFLHLYFRKGYTAWNNEIIKNTLFFVPYTFLFLQAFRKEHPLKNSFILSICTTAFIELSQLVFWLGEFQFSDLIYNTIGGMIGCGCWLLKERIVLKLKNV